jgi:hypothetical protein
VSIIFRRIEVLLELSLFSLQYFISDARVGISVLMTVLVRIGNYIIPIRSATTPFLVCSGTQTDFSRTNKTTIECLLLKLEGNSSRA